MADAETPQRTPEAFAHVNGQTLCWDSFGDPASAPLLLIMGLGAQMVLWDDDFCEWLARLGFYVIRFDNRDIGRSSRLDAAVQLDLTQLMMRRMQNQPIPAPYLLRDMAADAAALLSHLGIARAHIAGASMGGMIAQEMAIHMPERVASLISIMSTTGNPQLPPPKPEGAAIFMAPPPLTEEDYIANFCKTWRVLRAGSFPADEARDPARARRIWSRGVNPLGVMRQMTAIFASGDRTEALAAVRAPTLVIHGTPDPLVPVEAGRATAAAVPHARFLELPTMGHAIPMALWPDVTGAIAAHCRQAPA